MTQPQKGRLWGKASLAAGNLRPDLCGIEPFGPSAGGGRYGASAPFKDQGRAFSKADIQG